jgi:hypothetical protein
VYSGIVEVTTIVDEAGHEVTVLGHAVIVMTFVVYTVEAVIGPAAVVVAAETGQVV